MALLIDLENEIVLDYKFRLTIPTKIIRERILSVSQKVYLRWVDERKSMEILLQKPGEQDPGWFYVVDLKTCGKRNPNLRLVIPKEMRKSSLFANERKVRMICSDNRINLLPTEP